ncbi:MAG: ABC transporter permease [Gemmatimonadota bacterium]
MSLIDAVRYRIRTLVSPRSYGRELDDEIAHHLALEAQHQRRAAERLDGSVDPAREAAKVFGNVTYAKEERRRVSGIAFFDALGQDIRFATRVLRRRRVFTVVIVATLALGIGAATSIFSIADIVLFRSLPMPDANRVITVWQTRPKMKANPVRAGQWDRGSFSMPAFRDWRTAQTSFDAVAIWTTATTVVAGRGAPEELRIIRASASLLTVLGVQPEHGRGFTEGEDRVGGAPVALVSHDAWVTRYAGDRRVLGTLVNIDSVRYTIVGILPPDLALQRNGQAAYWVPAGQDAERANDAGAQDYWTIARLKRGVSIATAATETERLLHGPPSTDTRDNGIRLTPLQEDQTRTVRRPILILLGAAGLLLLIACANAGTLLLGEASGREAELRARGALGATRGRVIRQLLTESLVIALLAGALGSALAYAGTKFLVQFAPATITGLSAVHVDLRVLVAALVVSCATGMLFGIIPALSLSHGNDGGTMRLGGQTPRGRGRSQRALIACEVALSMVLLVAAGLLIRSFEKLTAVDPGFRTEQLLVAQLRLPEQQYGDSVRMRALVRDLVDRAVSLPGVVNAAVTTTPPFSGGSSSSSFEIEGRPLSLNAPSLEAQRRITSPEYFSTAGVRILSGRSYARTDDAGAPLVVVVGRALERRDWPGESALGKRIKWMGKWRTIVGVVDDVRLGTLHDDALPIVYAPYGQLVRRGDASLVVRTMPEAAGITAAIRSIIAEVAPGAPLRRIDEMSALVDATLADERFRTQLITLFAVVAAVLAAAGVYGVATTAANRRAQEIAVRLALGATNGSIARMVVGAGAVGVAIGGVVGGVLALAASRVLAPYVYAVGTADPVTFGLVVAILVVTTLGATWLPARRATRVSLTQALRGEHS